MDNMIETTQLGNGLFKLKIDMGNGRVDTVENLKTNIVNRVIVITVVKKIKRYVNHRKGLMNSGRAFSTLKKHNAIEALERRLNQSMHWDILGLAMQIGRMENDLREILPGKESRFFISHTKLVNRLTAWSDQYLLQLQSA